MSGFRRLSESVFVSPQISAADIAAAEELGITLVINNRPEGEEPRQTPGAEIETAARAAGMDYVAIPITLPTLTEGHVAAMADALDAASGPVLAYCRSGTRSTFLWALAQARGGMDPGEIMRAADNAGYDLSPIRAALDTLAAR